MCDIKSMIDSSMKQDWNKKEKETFERVYLVSDYKQSFLARSIVHVNKISKKKINDSAHIELWELAAQKQANSIQYNKV